MSDKQLSCARDVYEAAKAGENLYHRVPLWLTLAMIGEGIINANDEVSDAFKLALQMGPFTSQHMLNVNYFDQEMELDRIRDLNNGAKE
ncbi:MAG: hypothetical protein ABFD89_01490 [Bryobacteraceae bacterium]